MPAKSQPVKKDGTWSWRKQVRGHQLYVGGHPTKAAAEAAMQKELKLYGGPQPPFGKGPFKTTLAEALFAFAPRHLRRLKGARQECQRINRYLRLAGLPTFELEPLQAAQEVELTEAEERLDAMETDRRRGYRAKRKVSAANPAESDQGPSDATAAPQNGQPAKAKPRRKVQVYFKVKAVPPAPNQERPIPKCLRAHRASQEAATEGSDKMRRILAHTTMAEVSRHQMQELVDQMTAEVAAATVGLERALLRRLFNYARVVWHWTEPYDNPATQLEMPVIDNVRDRTMSVDEEALMDEALRSCRDQRIGPLTKLLTETAMRTSEPLLHALWKDVNWDARLLRLKDGKNKSRYVPLSERAVQALRELQALSDGKPDSPVATLTYEALKASWIRTCVRAGLEDLQLYDLRRTGATRVALEFGNIFLVQALTGHKTIQMAMRYTKTGARDLVNAWNTKKAREQAMADLAGRGHKADQSAPIAAQVEPATLSSAAPTAATGQVAPMTNPLTNPIPNPMTAAMPSGWAVQSWSMPSYGFSLKPSAPAVPAAPVEPPAPPAAESLPSNVIEGHFTRRRTA